MTADTLCPRCEGFGNTGTWRGIVYKCRHCEGTGRVPVVSGWRPHEPGETPPAIPMDPEHLMRACYDLIGYDLEHGIESDAYASYEPELAYEPGQGNYTICVDPVHPRPPGSAVDAQFYVTPREARVLAARLLRAASEAEMGSMKWKFKSLEDVERVQPRRCDEPGCTGVCMSADGLCTYGRGL